TTGVSVEEVRAVWKILNSVSNTLMSISCPRSVSEGVGLHFNFMFVGRSTMFLEVGKGSTNSPTRVKWICLRMLQQCHLETLLHILVSTSHENNQLQYLDSLRQGNEQHQH